MQLVRGRGRAAGTVLTIEEEGKPNNTGIPTPFGSARSLLCLSVSLSTYWDVVPLCFESDILLSLEHHSHRTRRDDRYLRTCTTTNKTLGSSHHWQFKEPTLRSSLDILPRIYKILITNHDRSRSTKNNDTTPSPMDDVVWQSPNGRSRHRLER